MTDERAPLLQHHNGNENGNSNFADEEGKDGIGSSAMGDRVPYNDYTTIDWLHDLVASHATSRALASNPWRHRLYNFQPWLTVCLTGVLTALVAYVVDVSESSVSDWKEGHCVGAWYLDRRACCAKDVAGGVSGEGCARWKEWTDGWGPGYALYVAIAVLYGTIACGVTMTTRKALPQAEEANDAAKYMYMASGSGIPELKTFISGFVIPHFLTVRVLVVKCVGATFAVASGMCLGKEGPFVHMSACVAEQVARLWPRYRENEGERRGIVSAGCAAGLSVAFGAPIGGVLFSFEEVSTYFPRRILHLAFLCSLIAAITLVRLNPLGTGSLVLFPTSYSDRTSVSPARQPLSLLLAVVLGAAGGVFGAIFCKANFAWSRNFRSIPFVRAHPVLETAAAALLTGLLQFPNPLIRTAGDETIKALLVDCTSPAELASPSFICRASSQPHLLGWYIHGTLTKLFLTTITFGVKVPSGIIIPSLDAGALFGRLVGQFVLQSPVPGAFATMGAAAFLAGVTRMTVSLAVIMLELTGDLQAVVPHMVAILVAKWVADALEPHGVYDLAQLVLGHPFLDAEGSEAGEVAAGRRVSDLLPTEDTMREITVRVGDDGCVRAAVLRDRVAKLRARGLLDAGLAIVRQDMSTANGRDVLVGYIAQGELSEGLAALPAPSDDVRVRFTPHPSPPHVPGADLSAFVDRTPLTLDPETPLDVLTELFAKLGIRYVCVVDHLGCLKGVVIKKRVVGFVEQLMHGGHE